MLVTSVDAQTTSGWQLCQLHERCNFFTVFFFALGPSNHVDHWPFSKSMAWCFRYSNNISTQTHFGVSFPPLQGYASSEHISHLQFEDDTLLLGPGNLKEAKATNKVIKIFKRPTGQTIWHQQKQINYFFPECKPGTEEKNTEDDGI